MLGIWVVELLKVPASVAGELADRIGPAGHEFPELLGRVRAAWVAAAHSYDRDWLLSEWTAGFASGGMLAVDAFELGAQESRDLARSWVVIDQC